MEWIAIILGTMLGIVTFALIVSFTKGRRISGFIIACLVGWITFSYSNQYMVPQLQLKYLDYKIKQNPIMATLAVAEPQKFNQYLDDVRTMLTQGEEPSRALIMAHKLVRDIFPKYLSHATNASIDIYIRSTIALYRELEKANPAYVIYTEFPQTVSDTDILPLLQNNYHRQIENRQKAMQIVILSAMNNPQVDPNMDIGKVGLTKIIQNLGNRYGAHSVIKTIATPNDPSLSPSTQAAIIISFYENILKQGIDRAGSVIRLIATEAQKKTVENS